LKLIVEGFQRQVLIGNASVHNKILMREIEREKPRGVSHCGLAVYMKNIFRQKKK
jgi:hypothetical protein